MAGWRVGYVVADKEIINVCAYMHDVITYTVCAVSQRAALRALELHDDIKKKTVGEYRKRVMYAAERIKDIPFMDLNLTDGTFYIFPSVKKTGLTSAQFCDRLFDECHIMASAGSACGRAGEGHVRFALINPVEVLKEAFDRIEKMKF